MALSPGHLASCATTALRLRLIWQWTVLIGIRCMDAISLHVYWSSAKSRNAARGPAFSRATMCASASIFSPFECRFRIVHAGSGPGQPPMIPDLIDGDREKPAAQVLAVEIRQTAVDDQEDVLREIVRVAVIASQDSGPSSDLSKPGVVDRPEEIGDGRAGTDAASHPRTQRSRPGHNGAPGGDFALCARSVDLPVDHLIT
jgi:hypothetical protein